MRMDADAPPSFRLFYVRPSEGPSDRGHVVTGAAEAYEAALLFAERWVTDAEDPELKVTVVDGDTGARHCFTLDLGTGAVGPC